MDLQKLTHRNLRVSVAVGMTLSVVIVVVASLLARGVLQIKTSLLGAELNDVAAILAFEQTHPDLTVTNVEKLPEREDENVFRYLVTTEDAEGHEVSYFSTFSGPPWTEIGSERLHE